MSIQWSTQSKQATEKDRHPERFCPADNCLWRSNGHKCPRHSEPDGYIFGHPVWLPRFPDGTLIPIKAVR